MLAHVLRFIGCVVVSALAAAALGELTFPGPNPFMAASIWCGAWATAIASVMYVLAAFAWSDYYMVRKKKSIDVATIARSASKTAFLITMTVTIGFLASARFRWIDW